MLAVANLRVDGGTQARAGIDAGTVSDYAEAFEELAGFDAEDLPPLDAVLDAGGNYWLWDGFHRLDAYKRLGVACAPVNVTEGTLDDARWLACGANARHGLPRSNKDKRKAVEMALRMRPDLSSRAVAEHCRVSHDFVNNLRKELSSDDSSTRTGLDGKARKMPKKPKPAPDGEGASPATPEDAEAVIAANADAQVHPPATEADNEAFRLANVKCALGQSVPPAFAPAFLAGERIDALLDALRSCERAVTALCESGHAPALRRACVAKQAKEGGPRRWQLDPLRSAVTRVKMSLPHTLCPHCWDAHPGRADADCNSCDGSGVVTKDAYLATQTALQHAVAGRDRIAEEEAA